MRQYRRTLPPGIYLFAPEIRLGKMTGSIVEVRSDFPADYACPAELEVTFGFWPLGFIPASLKGAPPSWLSGYPFLPGMEKLAEAPQFFLEQLKRHAEEQMQLMEQAALRPAEQWEKGECSSFPEVFP